MIVVGKPHFNPSGLLFWGVCVVLSLPVLSTINKITCPEPCQVRDPLREAFWAYEHHDRVEAERLWKWQIRIVKKQGRHPTRRAEICCLKLWIGRSLMERGHYAESEMYLKSALRLSQHMTLPKFYMEATSMRYLSKLYRLQGRVLEADMWSARAKSSDKNRLMHLALSSH